MQKLVENLFTENKYKKIKDLSMTLYGLSNDDYFILEEYQFEDFISFFDSERTNDIVDRFLKLDSKVGNYSKNTSMIIFLKVDNIRSFYTKYKNQIMLIEEDEYYFRKYIIVYTEEAETKLNGISTNEIFSIIADDENFNQFEDDMYFKEEYFIAIQLVVKIPFISIPKNEKKYISLQEKINDEFIEINLANDLNKVGKFLSLMNNDESNYSQLREDFLDEVYEGNLLKEINSIFKVEK